MLRKKMISIPASEIASQIHQNIDSDYDAFGQFSLEHCASRLAVVSHSAVITSQFQQCFESH